jgi:hypothetical protein
VHGENDAVAEVLREPRPYVVTSIDADYALDGDRIGE